MKLVNRTGNNNTETHCNIIMTKATQLFFALILSTKTIACTQAYVCTSGCTIPFFSRKQNKNRLCYKLNNNDPPIDPGGSLPIKPQQQQQNRERFLPKLNVTKLLLADPKEIESLIDLYTIPAYYQALESFPHVDVGSDVLRDDCKRFQCAIFDFDTGHDGKFTVFGSAGASLDSDAIFSNLHQAGRQQGQDQQPIMHPLAYIHDVLSVGNDRRINHAAPGNEKEAVVFCGPGLNTLHDQAEEMVKYISKVLDQLPIAHLHAGSYLDRGNVEVTIKNKQEFGKFFVGEDILTSSSGLDENKFVGDGSTSEYYCYDHDKSANTWTIRAEDRDKIKMVLSGRNLIDTPFKRTLIKLLDVAVASLQHDNNNDNSKKGGERHQPHLVLLCYSATSAEVAAAIQTWLDRATEVSNNLQQSQSLLRKAVTVVTLGATSRNFPDGPAYIHVSMNDDTIATTFGVSDSTPKEWGGEDAVFLHAHSPYFYARTPSSFSSTSAAAIAATAATATTTCSTKQKIEGMTRTTMSTTAPNNSNNNDDKNENLMLNNDAHNLQACLVQWLAIIMRVNGARSFRFFYNVIANDRLDNPPNLEEEVFPAMIRATRGHEWLWNPRESLGFSNDDDDGDGGVDYDDDYIIMDEMDAKMVLEWQYGYDAYEEIVEAMQDTDFFT